MTIESHNELPQTNQRHHEEEAQNTDRRMTERTQLEKALTHISLACFFVGHRQTVQTQTRRRKTQHLIMVSTVCLQNVLLKFEGKEMKYITHQLFT